jgi:hypothetical protein
MRATRTPAREHVKGEWFEHEDMFTLLIDIKLQARAS